MAYISKCCKFFSRRALLQNKTKMLVKNFHEQIHNLACQSNETKSRTYENTFQDILTMYWKQREQPNKMNSFGKILAMRELLRRINVTDEDMNKMNIIHVTGELLFKRIAALLLLDSTKRCLFFYSSNPRKHLMTLEVTVVKIFRERSCYD